jgi:hypothetical protein
MDLHQSRQHLPVLMVVGVRYLVGLRARPVDLICCLQQPLVLLALEEGSVAAVHRLQVARQVVQGVK